MIFDCIVFAYTSIIVKDTMSEQVFWGHLFSLALEGLTRVPQ